MAYRIAGEEMPAPWRDIAENRPESCHFEFPGSTHAIRTRVEGLDERAQKNRVCQVKNTEETAHTGRRSLKISAASVLAGENVYVYKKTYYTPEDFYDSRYDPSFHRWCIQDKLFAGTPIFQSMGNMRR